jgi:hypothetical protein
MITRIPVNHTIDNRSLSELVTDALELPPTMGQEVHCTAVFEVAHPSGTIHQQRLDLRIIGTTKMIADWIARHDTPGTSVAIATKNMEGNHYCSMFEATHSGWQCRIDDMWGNKGGKVFLDMRGCWQVS